MDGSRRIFYKLMATVNTPCQRVSFLGTMKFLVSLILTAGLTQGFVAPSKSSRASTELLMSESGEPVLNKWSRYVVGCCHRRRIHNPFSLSW